MQLALAVLLPPVAVLQCGSTRQAWLNVLLTAAFWVPGVLHALWVVNRFNTAQNRRRPRLGKPNPFGSL